MEVIIDIECDGLKDWKKLWVIVCREVESGDVHVFERPDLNPHPFIEFSKGVTKWVGHNLIAFDYLVLQWFALAIYVRVDDLLDTLILSRLVHYLQEGGHSLENWGEILETPKGSFKDWSKLSKEMIDYCIQDTKTTLLLFKDLERFARGKQFAQAISTEHKLQLINNTLHTNGFSFSFDEAKGLYDTLSNLIYTLEKEIQEDFPKRSKLIKEVTPRGTKAGNLSASSFKWLAPDDKGVLDLSSYTSSSPFSLFQWVEFNPKSPKQVVERLNEVGWKPFNKTKGHLEAERARDKEKLKYYKVYGWKVDEENLDTLPLDTPEGAKKLVRYLKLYSRRSTLEEWMTAYNHEDGKIHGKFNHIGGWTHRMSHIQPNMANAPSIAPRITNKDIFKEMSEYGKRMRGLWTVSNPMNNLLGVDADGIQMRIFAHLINDPKLIDALVKGRKEDGTDIHTVHQKALGPVCRTRDNAKTFIYAFLLGAGVAKVAEIFGCSNGEAEQARANFLQFYPGLGELQTERIPRDAKQGYFEGLDGRLVIPYGDDVKTRMRTMLAGYLQNGEAVIMKTACVQWHEELKGIDGWWFRNFIHDEWQTEVRPDISAYVSLVQMQSIRDMAVKFNMNCPLEANYKIGKTWMDTH